MGVPMTRRDFLNSALLDSGSALLGAACPAQPLARELDRGGLAGAMRPTRSVVTAAWVRMPCRRAGRHAQKVSGTIFWQGDGGHLD